MTYENILKYEKIYEERSQKDPYYKQALKSLLKTKSEHPEHSKRSAEAEAARKNSKKLGVK